MAVKVIVNADDFGLSDGVNRAVIDCYQSGALTSATLMVNTPGFDQAVTMGRENAGLGIGLHFNLTLGAPLAGAVEVPSLVDGGGRFFGRSAFEKRVMRGKIRHADVVRELSLQLDKALQSGLSIGHVDSHQHVHVFSPVTKAVGRAAQKHGLAVRVPHVWSPDTDITLRRKVRSTLLRLLVANMQRLLPDDVATNAGFRSSFDITAGARLPMVNDFDLMFMGLDSSPVELMVHPAYADDVHRSTTAISDYSEAELALLLERNVMSRLPDGAVLGCFGAC